MRPSGRTGSTTTDPGCVITSRIARTPPGSKHFIAPHAEDRALIDYFTAQNFRDWNGRLCVTASK